MQSQQVAGISWETMMRRRSSLSVPGRRLSLLPVDPTKDQFFGLDEIVLNEAMGSFLDPFSSTSNEQSYLAFEHAQVRKNSLLGGITGNTNMWGGFQNGGDQLVNNSSNFNSGLLDGFQSDGSLLAYNRQGNDMDVNNNFLNSMVAMQTNGFLNSTRNMVLGSSSNSFVGSMRNTILGSMRNSLALGSITPLTDRTTLNERVDVDAHQGAYSLSDFGNLFKPSMLDQDVTLTRQMIPPNTYSSDGSTNSLVTRSIVSDQVLVPDFTPTTMPTETTQQTFISRVIRPINTNEDADDDDEEKDGDGLNRFKPFHEEKWTLRYKELLAFHSQHGHAAVPHTYLPNPQLARWVKRQRRQYKLREDGRSTTMTTERLEMLSSVGFIWDSHDVNWREKLYCLTVFRKEAGNCNVPSNYRDKKLATWVKCQRRQYKLYCDGKPSAMNPDRIKILETIGFEWEIRSNGARRQSSTSSASEDDPIQI